VVKNALVNISMPFLGRKILFLNGLEGEKVSAVFGPKEGEIFGTGISLLGLIILSPVV
jgi:hypothetical protein